MSAFDAKECSYPQYSVIDETKTLATLNRHADRLIEFARAGRVFGAVQGCRSFCNKDTRKTVFLTVQKAHGQETNNLWLSLFWGGKKNKKNKEVRLTRQEGAKDLWEYCEYPESISIPQKLAPALKEEPVPSLGGDSCMRAYVIAAYIRQARP